MTMTRHALLLIFLMLSAKTTPARPVRDANDRPNFVLLFMDDLGYGDLGFTGHPTTKTPNLDRLAYEGKILTTWYSGCAVCTGSRAALMTGRQFPRTGLPGVLGPCERDGLNLEETTVASQLKQKDYATAIVGKWHLGQRHVYLPASRGFDQYLGIPYSDDMGDGIASGCPANAEKHTHRASGTVTDDEEISIGAAWTSRKEYEEAGFLDRNTESTFEDAKMDGDPAGHYLPLVAQAHNQTRIVEQPLDFTTLAQKYNSFATSFIQDHKDEPFFLYVPFSHVHCTSGSQPEMQYAGCPFRNATSRGSFGNALAEADWIVGNIVQTLRQLQLEENTLILFTSDNGPWMLRGLSGGSGGLFTGRFASYDDTGKGSTWEGGIRMPAFAHWKGQISPYSRSSEIISSLDVLPTLSALAGVPLPPNRAIDGKDMSQILLQPTGRSKHDFLFFYGSCSDQSYFNVDAVRHGKYKAHWCTGPGFGPREKNKIYQPYPLLFNVDKDPSEAEPISQGEMPSDPEHRRVMDRIMAAYAMEVATFAKGKIVPAPDGPGEGPGQYGVCCDRSRQCNCARSTTEDGSFGILNLGSKQHHDRYHDALGELEPSPPQTRAQLSLQRANEKQV